MEWLTPFQASCNAADGLQLWFSDNGLEGDVVGDLFDQQFSAKVVVKPLSDIFRKTSRSERVRITTKIVEIKAIGAPTGG